MFQRKELAKILDLTSTSYQLLMWVNGEIKKGHNLFVNKHEEGSTFEVSRTFLKTNEGNFPPHLRFEAKDLDQVAHIFQSFLQTSFQFTKSEVPEYVCSYGCCFCGALIQQTRLALQSTSANDRAAAYQLKLLYLKGVADELGLALVDDELSKFMGQSKEMGMRVTLCTYVSEMYRRSEYASQGGSVYVLWQELKHFYKDDKKKKQLLELEDILKAEAELRQGLSEFASKL